jgi:exodeoxyribonuclease V beta subunit
MAPEPWAPMATAAIEEVLATELRRGDDASVRLRDIAPARRCSELEFLLPVARADADTLALTRERLASAFADHPQGLPPGYADRVAGLGFSALRGFLKGFIDLVFEHDGQTYVVDYKTNFLGETADDYAPSHLDEAMAEDHYILQSHLYAVALVRHLTRHRPDFDLDRHFGGLAYLFVRGMSPQTGATRGVWLHRPPAARIAALSARLEGRR